jgi:hypothetical protein
MKICENLPYIITLAFVQGYVNRVINGSYSSGEIAGELKNLCDLEFEVKFKFTSIYRTQLCMKTLKR